MDSSTWQKVSRRWTGTHGKCLVALLVTGATSLLRDLRVGRPPFVAVGSAVAHRGQRLPPRTTCSAPAAPVDDMERRYLMPIVVVVFSETLVDSNFG